MLFFKDEKEYTACLARCDTAYSGVSMKRFLLMTDTFLVDVFLVSKGRGLWGNDATWDWLLHSRGKLSTTALTSNRAKPLGKGNGYQYLKELKVLKGSSKLPAFDFTVSDGRFLRAILPNETGEVFSGMGTGTRTTEKVQFILRRRRSLRETFIAVYDFSGNATAVKNVKIIPIHDSTGAIRTDAAGLAITDAAGDETVIGLDLNGRPTISKRFLRKIPFERILFQKSPEVRF